MENSKQISSDDNSGEHNLENNELDDSEPDFGVWTQEEVDSINRSAKLFAVEIQRYFD